MLVFSKHIVIPVKKANDRTLKANRVGVKFERNFTS